ncbi:MAG: DUF4172 domain-containing protein [Tannerella sp.]|jgi:Fic family protein|nr:DUF4172 domain-containing protein [Tannerella sp.]
MSEHIWRQKGWPYLTWNNKELLHILGEVRNRQGRLAGKASLLGMDLKKEMLLKTVSNDIVRSAELENETLDETAVRASVAHRLKIHLARQLKTDPAVDRTVQTMIDALQNYRQPVTEETILGWHEAFGQNAGMHHPAPLEPDNADSCLLHLHNPADIRDETARFLKWYNTRHPTDPVIKAGIAHLRFTCIQPFSNGNGYIARLLTDIFLTRADGFPQHFYSLSAQIARQRELYSRMLLQAQHDSLDITEWLMWFLYCFEAALIEAENILTRTLEKSKFWEKYRLIRLNERQVRMINILWEGADCRLTSSYWANINLCSPDTALRDIQDLIHKNILHRKSSGGRSTCYELN